MKIRTVSFDKTIGMPNFSNDRPGIVYADLEDGETKEEAWSKLNQDMIAWHKKEYPHLYQDKDTYPKPYDGRDRFHEITSGQLPATEIVYGSGFIPTISKDKEQPADNLTAIQTAETLEELQSYKLLASNHKPLYDAYCQRIKELSK